MDLLILGIDGAGSDTIFAMDMPFTQHLLNERVQLPVREDLWSRGWSEILTGLHARETAAAYERPLLDGTPRFTQGYSSTDYERVPGCEPLWQRVNRAGKRLVFVNVPTTIPAPTVSGAFLAGAGAGHSPSSRIPEAACFPAALSRELLGRNIIWEQRFNVSGIQCLDVLVERCIRGSLQRTEVFVEWCRRESADVGFVMHREFSTLTNLFMHELAILLRNPNLKARTRIQKRLSEYFRVLDDLLRSTVEALAPRHVLVVSDHSSHLYERSLNINEFLLGTGLLRFRDPSVRRTLKRVRARAQAAQARMARSIGVASLARSPAHRTYWSTSATDFERSLAFGNHYIPGIYLNDERFGGPVRAEDSSAIIRTLVDAFNGTMEARQAGMIAMPYRELYPAAYGERALPDIWIDLPEGVFPEQKGRFVQPNPLLGSVQNLADAPRDVVSGMKGRKPVCAVEHDAANAIHLDNGAACDLTVVYRVVDHYLALS